MNAIYSHDVAYLCLHFARNKVTVRCTLLEFACGKLLNILALFLCIDMSDVTSTVIAS